jgi:hypothetical protein
VVLCGTAREKIAPRHLRFFENGKVLFQKNRLTVDTGQPDLAWPHFAPPVHHRYIRQKGIMLLAAIEKN